MKALPRILLALASASLVAGSVQAADPFFGIWTLQPARCHGDAKLVPHSLVLRWSEAGTDSVEVQAEGEDAQGRPIHYRYVAVYDGRPHPPTGPWNWDQVINRRLDERTREDTFFKTGTLLGTERRTVSEDGTSLTYDSRFGDEWSVLVFERQ